MSVHISQVLMEERQALVGIGLDADVQVGQEEGSPVRFIEGESLGQGRVVGHRKMLPQSDPARWEDWKRAVRQALRPEADPDPLVENLLRD